MKKTVFKLSGVIIAMAILLPLGFIEKEALAGVDVNIGINIPLPPPPGVIFSSPPEMLVIPGSPVVVAPHPEVDVFFYSGFWWSPRGDRWYRSRAYNGPWKLMEHRYVPSYVRGVPRDYRSAYAHEHRIPYGQWKKQHRYQPNEPYRGRPEYHPEKRKYEKSKEDGHGRGQGRGHGHGHGHEYERGN